MTIDLTQAVLEWDIDHAGAQSADALPKEKRFFGRLLETLIATAHIRYQPFQNDLVSDFVSKLRRWLAQLQPAERPAAFLLATKVVFITSRQFESLQRFLFTTKIRQLLLERVIARTGTPPHNYTNAARRLDAEMDRTLFVGNSPSSHINSFVHLNSDYFFDRAHRRLVGPDAKFWCYPQRRLEDALTAAEQAITEQFEKDILSNDEYLAGKTRIVVVEDFSGSGSDLYQTATRLARAKLPIQEIVLAPVIATQFACDKLQSVFPTLASSGKRFDLVCALRLPHKFRCFDAGIVPPSPEPSYLDGGEPRLALSTDVRQLSERLFNDHFAAPAAPKRPLDASERHGFGGLALAFALFTNCPDNSLPLLWNETKDFFPLFRRASNHL